MSDKSVANTAAGKMESPTEHASSADVKGDSGATSNNVEVKAGVGTQFSGADPEDKKDATKGDGDPSSNSPSPPTSSAVVAAASTAAIRKVTLQDLTKFGPGDKTNVKFAVLIGLIEIGQVSNKEVVNTVLQLVRYKLFKLICF